MGFQDMQNMHKEMTRSMSQNMQSMSQNMLALKRSAVRGNLAKKISNDAGKLMRQSVRFLLVEDDEDDEEDIRNGDGDEEEEAEVWKPGQEVYVRHESPYRPGKKKNFEWKKGTVVHKNPGTYFVRKYDHKNDKSVQLA